MFLFRVCSLLLPMLFGQCYYMLYYFLEHDLRFFSLLGLAWMIALFWITIDTWFFAI